MRKTIITALLAAPLLASAATNLVSNGSFESQSQSPGSWGIYNKVDGWKTGSNGLEIRDANAGHAQDGNNFAELDTTRNSWIKQRLNTKAGQDYTLSFYFSNREGTKPSTNGIAVAFGGHHYIAKSPVKNMSGDNQWSMFTTTIHAKGASWLTFAGRGKSDSYGSSLDHIAVTAAVPEPETYALMLAGLVGVVFVGRRRMNRA